MVTQKLSELKLVTSRVNKFEIYDCDPKTLNFENAVTVRRSTVYLTFLYFYIGNGEATRQDIFVYSTLVMTNDECTLVGPLSI